jgi:hypothetical protein
MQVRCRLASLACANDYTAYHGLSAPYTYLCKHRTKTPMMACLPLSDNQTRWELQRLFVCMQVRCRLVVLSSLACTNDCTREGEQSFGFFPSLSLERYRGINTLIWGYMYCTEFSTPI